MCEREKHDWGSRGRRFKSCQPDQCQPDQDSRRSTAILADRSQKKTATPGGYVAQPLSSSPRGVMMQAVIMRDEVAVVTVLPGGKGHRGFDPSRVDISWRTDDKRAAEIDAGPLTRWVWCGGLKAVGTS